MKNAHVLPLTTKWF